VHPGAAGTRPGGRQRGVLRRQAEAHQGRDECRFGQRAHRLGRADSGRAAAPGLQSPDRCLVKVPEAAVPHVGGNSRQEGKRHRAVKHWPAHRGFGFPRLPRLPGSPTCKRHHGPVPLHCGPGPIGHWAKSARAREVARPRRDPPPMRLTPHAQDSEAWLQVPGSSARLESSSEPRMLLLFARQQCFAQLSSGPTAGLQSPEYGPLARRQGLVSTATMSAACHLECHHRNGGIAP